MKIKMISLAMAAAVAAATFSCQSAEYVPNPEIQNVETNIVYGGHGRCRLDVMWTKDSVHGLPVVVWFHGGGLVKGDKFFLPLTDHHIVQVAVRYPFLSGEDAVSAEQLLDAAAQAVAWTVKNIERYKGNPRKVFLSGHSAGGYIAMMLGMDPKWLGKYEIGTTDLAGIVPLSGQATTHFNVRKFSGDKDPQFMPKIDSLAPLGHVAEKDYPPMLVVSGDPAAKEWKCRAEENELLVASIRACGHTNDVEYVRLPQMDHGSMRFPGYMYLQRFIRRYVPYPRKASAVSAANPALNAEVRVGGADGTR